MFEADSSVHGLVRKSLSDEQWDEKKMQDCRHTADGQETKGRKKPVIPTIRSPDPPFVSRPLSHTIHENEGPSFPVSSRRMSAASAVREDSDPEQMNGSIVHLMCSPCAVAVTY